MNKVSIKRLVLTLILGLSSVMTLPAYAWPDTDEMNMCGAATKIVQAYGGDHRNWAAHDNYVAQRGNAYYQRTNCPQSKATKNYKRKNWTPGAKMRMKPKAHKKNAHKKHTKHMQMKHSKKMHKLHQNTNHKKNADCIRTDALNNGGAIVKKVAHRTLTDAQFLRQAHALLNMGKVRNMSKVKHVSKVHSPKHKNHADCVRTDGLNSSGGIVRVVQSK